MATETTNYGLTKPDPEDFYDVSIFNTNYDKIDAALAEAAKTGGGGIKVIPKGEDLPLPQRQEGYLYLKVLDSVEIELNNQIRVSSVRRGFRVHRVRKARKEIPVKR